LDPTGHRFAEFLPGEGAFVFIGCEEEFHGFWSWAITSNFLLPLLAAVIILLKIRIRRFLA